MLKVENLVVNYGVIQALKGISFEVNEGEVIALIGANGAGKTTTLQTISGMLSPNSGKVLLNDVDITTIPGHKIVSMGMAHVPEGRRVFPGLTVLENLKMGAYTRSNKTEIAEPSMGLSPIYVDEIFKIIQSISDAGTTVLLVEQNAKKALAIADRAYVLETGNVVLSGDAKDLLNDDSIKKAYLGE